VSRRETLPLEMPRKIKAAPAKSVDYAAPQGSAWGRFTTGFASHARSWAANTFSREQLVAAAKSLAWVGPLTLLIWIYAEREQLHTVPSVTVPIRVVHNDPGRVVEILDPPDKNLLVTLKGPRGQVDAVQEELRLTGQPVEVELERDVQPGELTIRADRVGTDRRFTDRGVTVSNSQPGTLRVRVDAVAEEDVRVISKGTTTGGYDVTFDPPTVKVRGPAAVLRTARAEHRLQAEADLTDRPEIAAASAGGQPSLTIKDVPLTLDINNTFTRFSGAKTVIATVTFKAQKELLLPYVSLRASVTKDINGFVLDHQPTVNNVTVVGPEDKIAELSTQPPKATFEVVNAVAGQHTATVEFHLPPGVTVKQAPDGGKIQYTLTQR
jgi:hypothetical protein